MLANKTLAQVSPEVGELRYFVDVDNSYNINLATESLNQNRAQNETNQWQYPKTPIFSLGFQKSPHWFAWTVKATTLAADQRSTTSQYIFETPFASTDYLDVWIYDAENNLILEKSAGDKTAFENREILARNFLFAVPWDAQSDLRIIMRVQTTDTLRFASKLWAADQFWLYEEKQGRWHGVYFGIIIAMLLYNVSLAAGVREKAFYYYLLWLSMMSLAVATDLGYGFEILWPDSVSWNERAYSIFNCLGAGFAALFFGEALSINRKDNPGETRLLYTLAAAGIASAIACLFIPVIYTLQLTSIVGAIIIGLLVYLVAERVFKANLQAALLLLAFSIVVIGGSIRILNNFGFISSLSNAEYYLEVGTAVEVLLLSIFLSSRVYNDRRKRSEAQQELISLQKTMYTDLEKIVDERTHELETLNKLLKETSVTDPLTGLKNRRFFDEKISKLVDFTSRADSTISIMMIDIDHFKDVNDTYGHQVGDECLCHFADILKSVIVRETDLVARYGGEEFIVALSNCDEKSAKTVAEKIRASLCSAPLISEKNKVNLSCSIGLVSHRPDTKFDADLLIKQADAALYEAKENGRNRVEVIQENPDSTWSAA